MLSISKTEAVSRMMQALDGTIISSLDDPQNDTVVQAIRALDTTVQKVQLENEWNFNFTGPVTAVADNSNEITLPADLVYFKPLTWTNGSIWDLTVKQGQVWDKRNGTTAVGGTLKYIGSRIFTYEQLPASIQNYCTEKAKYEFVSLGAKVNAARIQIYYTNMIEARVAAFKWDAEQQFSAMDFTPSMRQNRWGRPGGGGAGRNWWEGI